MGNFLGINSKNWISIVGLSFILVPFQNCTPGFESKGPISVSSASSQLPETSEGNLAKGIELYNRNCAQCHGEVATSVKRGSLPAGIRAAFQTVTQMSYLSSISDEDLGLIALALSDLPPEIDIEDIPPLAEFQCETPQPLIEESLKRLSKLQIENTVRSLLSRAIPASNLNSTYSAVMLGVYIPTDNSTHYNESDNSVGVDHVNEYFQLADQFGQAIGQSDQVAFNFMQSYIQLGPSSCNLVQGNVSNQCYQAFARNFGLRAFRRPLKEGQDLNELNILLTRTVAASVSESVSNIVFKSLLMPNFLTHLKNNELERGGNEYRLSSYALASKLSYLLTNDMPTEGLFELASQYQAAPENLMTEAVALVMNQQDTEVRNSLKSFYRQWLKLDEIAISNPSSQNLQILEPNITPNASLRQAMIDEILDLADYNFKSEGTFATLFTSNVAVTDHPGLMSIYDQTQPVESVDSIQQGSEVRYPASVRAGLLTRSGFLVEDTTSKHHIIRGVRLLSDILCIPPGAPMGLETEGTTGNSGGTELSSREAVQIGTSGSSCIGCHSNINPFGFAFSHYNTFGGYEEVENILDSQGNLINRTVTVDAAVELPVASGMTGEIQNAIDLSERVSESEKAKACFTRNFFRFAMRRDEVDSQDSCQMSRAKQAIDENQSLQSFLQNFIQDPSFLNIRKTP